MATTLDIADLVTDLLPETEREIAADTLVDWDGAKERAIALAEIELYGSEPDEDTITDSRIRQHLAEMATARLCGYAIDYYMGKARLSDAKEGATLAYYNRAEILQDKRRELLLSVGARQAMVRELVEAQLHDADDVGDVNVMRISAAESGYRQQAYMATPDPWEQASAR